MLDLTQLWCSLPSEGTYPEAGRSSRAHTFGGSGSAGFRSARGGPKALFMVWRFQDSMPPTRSIDFTCLASRDARS